MRVVFTQHAKARCQDYDLDRAKVIKNFNNAKLVVTLRHVKKHNKIFHRKSAGRLSYRWADGVLYTIKKKRKYLSVITITPKKREEVQFV